MNVLLISTYELGRQPFGLTSPAAWLKEQGFEVKCLDLAVQVLNMQWVSEADLIAFYVPMHTATRLAIERLADIRQWNPDAHICFYGLYAPMNESYLKRLGVESIIGGEFEEPLLRLCLQLAKQVSSPPEKIRQIGIFLEKQKFRIPDRQDLPALNKYVKLICGEADQRIVGYTEASRGCKHTCRHCPIVPVYRGRFRIVQKDVVLADIAQQIEQGAQHITFGDPDFFNGIGHAIPIVEELHRQFPHVTYDVTIKIEHLLKYKQFLPTLRESGCLFITSAVESFDDRILSLLHKGHTREDILIANDLCKRNNLFLIPTFVAFTPWTSLDVYQDFLEMLVELNWVEVVHPIQLGIRLLIPNGSMLLNLPEIQPYLGEFDEAELSYNWTHPDPGMDFLQEEIMNIVAADSNPIAHRQEIFRKVWQLVAEISSEPFVLSQDTLTASRATIPYLNEPWYC